MVSMYSMRLDTTTILPFSVIGLTINEVEISKANNIADRYLIKFFAKINNVFACSQ